MPEPTPERASEAPAGKEEPLIEKTSLPEISGMPPIPPVPSPSSEPKSIASLPPIPREPKSPSIPQAAPTPPAPSPSSEPKGIASLPPIPREPKSPSIPQAAPTPPRRAVPPPIPPVKVEDPDWWRMGCVPFIVLLMAAAAGDLCFPNANGAFGLGAAIGSALLILGVLILRKDLSRGERCFLLALAAISFLALSATGSVLNWGAALGLPLLLLLTPRRQKRIEPGTRYRCWWGFWVARRTRQEGKRGLRATLRQSLPLLICILAGATCFVLFLMIFASGNPVVMQVWEQIATYWNKLVGWLDISWDFVFHALMWICGIFLFGFYAFRRPESPDSPGQPASQQVKNPAARTVLPFLPACILLGVNLAFGIATSTDITYLWFHRVPEGISQTTYLHEGAASITWASVMAALLLLFFFRRKGSARYNRFPRFLGYVLVLQTFLLAASVYMRLYYQIGDYGFTTLRIRAAEAMLLGLIGLIILLCYMVTDGGFWKYARLCLGSMLLVFVAFGICSPSRLAGTLNMRYLATHPHWTFGIEDFGVGRFDVKENLPFAEYVYASANPGRSAHQDLKRLRENSHPYDSGRGMKANHEISSVAFLKQLEKAALEVERQVLSGTWTTWNAALQQDIPAAESILGRPIKTEFPCCRETP